MKQTKWVGYVAAIVLAVALLGCGSSEEGGTPGGNRQGSGNQPVPTPAPGPSIVTIRLATGDSATLDPTRKTATLNPVAVILKLKTERLSANLGFLPEAPTLSGRCEALREIVKLEQSLPGAPSSFGRELGLEAGYWSIRNDLAEAKTALEAELAGRSLDYRIVLPQESLAAKSFPEPALFKLQSHPWRSWDQVVATVGHALNPDSHVYMNVRLSIAELCDLLSNDMAFGLDSGTVIVFDDSTE